MKELIVEAKNDNLHTVLNFLNGELEVHDCAIKTMMQIEIAVEEIFVNIANYAYDNSDGNVVIQVEIDGEPTVCSITFIDEGKEYNPLAKEDPDITLSAEERSIGGLGIYMVKKTMDSVQYKYENGKNVFVVSKMIG